MLQASKTRVGGLVHRITSKAGVRVMRQSTYDKFHDWAWKWDHYAMAMGEIEAFWRNSHFPNLEEDPQRVELMCSLTGTQPSEAMHLVAWLHEALDVSGAVCEMGCASGTTSALIAHEILSSSRDLWLFDSFQGLSRPTAEDALINDIYDLGSMEAYEGAMAYPEEEMQQRLVDVGFPKARTHTIAGFVPESLDQPDLPDPIAFAYVDFDLYAPIAASLQWLHGRAVPGTILMIDDYGWFSSGAKTAVDEFVAAHPGQYEAREPESWVGHFVGLKRRA
jgi:hypothetical protein